MDLNQIVQDLAKDVVSFLPPSLFAQNQSELSPLIKSLVVACQNQNDLSYVKIFQSFKETKAASLALLEKEKDSIVEAMTAIEMFFMREPTLQKQPNPQIQQQKSLPFPTVDVFRTIFASARWSLMVEFARILTILCKVDTLPNATPLPPSFLSSIFENRNLFFVNQIPDPNTSANPQAQQQSDISLLIAPGIENCVRKILHYAPTIFNLHKAKTSELFKIPETQQLFKKYQNVNKTLTNPKNSQNNAVLGAISLYCDLVKPEIGEFLIELCGTLLPKYYPNEDFKPIISPKPTIMQPQQKTSTAPKNEEIIDLDSEEAEIPQPTQKMMIKSQTPPSFPQVSVKQEQKPTIITNIPLNSPKNNNLQKTQQQQQQPQQMQITTRPQSSRIVFPKHDVTNEQFSILLQETVNSAAKSFKTQKIDKTSFNFEKILKQEKEFFETAKSCYSTINNSVLLFQQQFEQKQKAEEYQQILSELKAEEASKHEIMNSFNRFEVKDLPEKNVFLNFENR